MPNGANAAVQNNATPDSLRRCNLALALCQATSQYEAARMLILCGLEPSSETACRLFVRLCPIDFRIKGAAERDRETLNLTDAGWSLGNEDPRRQ
jgi:hypothetical protein